MTTRLNFTKRSLTALPSPEHGKRVYYYDTKCRGLSLCAYSSGKRSFQLYRKIQGKPERILIGHSPEITVEQARKHAQNLIARIAAGDNPNEIKRALRGEMTLKALHEYYMEHYAKIHKKSYQDDQRLFNRYMLKWQNRKLSYITTQDIRQHHADIGSKNGQTGANRMLAMLHTMFNKAIEWGFCKHNPASGIKKFREKSRDRFLQKDELPRFFAAVAAETNTTIRDYVYLSLLTGARRSNVLAMCWQQINFTEKLWRIPETKNGEPLIVPLSDEAVKILHERKTHSQSEFVFPSATSASGHLQEPRKGWERILKRAKIENLRIHDLRRTLGSWQAAEGASLSIIGKSLGHKSVHTTAIYARLNIDPVRASIDTATDAMMKAARGEVTHEDTET